MKERWAIATFVRGDLTPVAIRTPNGFLNITGYTLDASCLLFDVTHTGFGGAGTARISGKPDVSGTINYDLDIDAAPFGASLAMFPGTSGLMYFYVSNTNAPIGILGKAISCPVIVEKLHFETAITSQVKGSIDVKQDLLAPNAFAPLSPPALAFPSAA